MAQSRFTGVYRGVVLDNSDPSQAGRLLVIVPSVPANKQPLWALPFAPRSAGSQVPAVSSTVRIEYEEGNPHYPIWLSSAPGLDLGALQIRKTIRWLHTGGRFSRLRRTTLSPAHLFIRL
jgi:hypothetical protein